MLSLCKLQYHLLYLPLFFLSPSLSLSLSYPLFLHPFRPSGWDSDKRIVVLCEQMKHINPREPLKNIINPPRATMVSIY